MIDSGVERRRYLGVRAIRIANRQQDQPILRRHPVAAHHGEHPCRHIDGQPQVTGDLSRGLLVDDHAAVQIGRQSERNARGTSSQLVSTNQP